MAAIALVSCTSEPIQPELNPLPAALEVTPDLLVSGADGATLTINGSGFIPSSRARWNGADRTTHYQDSQTLTVDLGASDVAHVGYAGLTVVNGPPGGGESGMLQVTIGYPAPTITAISPASTPMLSGDGSLTLTISGSGFTSATGIRFGLDMLSASSVTPTTITATAPNHRFAVPGTYPVLVSNPGPGGGTSNTVDFAVAYPVPVVVSLSPDSALTGSGFTMTVNGSGFGTGTVVRWNGSDRVTTFVSVTRVTAAIPAADVASESDATVTVFNPAPGGGTSAGTQFHVREQAPIITGIDPGFVTSGSGARVVTVTGTNFRSGATAQWNGQDRASTLTGTTSMTISLTDADVANPTGGQVTVTNPGASGQSNAIAFPVMAAGASLTIDRTIDLVHADVVYDDSRGVLYASVPGTASQHANEIVRIDPATGDITGFVNVGSNPATLAITEDGQYLYVALLGAPRITRVTLASFTKDIDIDLPSGGFFGSNYGEDIVPLPGAPHTIAVSTFYTGLSPRNAGTFLYDDGVRRSAAGPGHTGSNRITRGPTAARIYGYNNETTEFGFRSLLVASDGLHEETVTGGLIAGFGVDIEYSGGFVYATTGEVVDVGSMQKIGTIPSAGRVLPDAALGRVHFLSGNTISTFHYRSFGNIGSFTDPSLDGHARLVRWGTDGLAAGGGATIVLLRGGLVAP